MKKTQHEIATRMIELAEKNYNCSQILMVQALEESEKNNPDLVKEVRVWSDLPNHIKAEIKALVQTHIGGKSK